MGGSIPDHTLQREKKIGRKNEAWLGKTAPKKARLSQENKGQGVVKTNGNSIKTSWASKIKPIRYYWWVSSLTNVGGGQGKKSERKKEKAENKNWGGHH